MINWRNIQVVEFPDKTYALRRGWIFYSFKDFQHPRFWLSASSMWMRDCKRFYKPEVDALKNQLLNRKKWSEKYGKVCRETST